MVDADFQQKTLYRLFNMARSADYIAAEGCPSRRMMPDDRPKRQGARANCPEPGGRGNGCFPPKSNPRILLTFLGDSPPRKGGTAWGLRGAAGGKTGVPLLGRGVGEPAGYCARQPSPGGSLPFAIEGAASVPLSRLRYFATGLNTRAAQSARYRKPKGFLSAFVFFLRGAAGRPQKHKPKRNC